jgi:hypothetical protein
MKKLGQKRLIIVTVSWRGVEWSPQSTVSSLTPTHGTCDFFPRVGGAGLQVDQDKTEQRDGAKCDCSDGTQGPLSPDASWVQRLRAGISHGSKTGSD